MATISDLIGLLFPIINPHASTLVRHASQLRVAGFLPAEDENLTALETATFLAVVAGARAPTEAVEAARVFASLPLIAVGGLPRESRDCPQGGTRLGMAIRSPPADVQSPLWAGARRSFVAAFEVLIHQAEDPARKLKELPSAIGIMRNLQHPYALISIGRA